MATRIKYRRDTPGNWSAKNPVLAAGEPGYEISAGKSRFKVGDGVTAWNALPYHLDAGEVSATYVPKWKASTAYLAGDKVLSPNGDVVSAIANFTSGASYNAANWNLSTSYTTRTTLGQQDNATRQDAALLRVRAALGKTAAGISKTNIFIFGHSMNAGHRVTSYKDMLHNAIGVSVRRKLGLGSDGGAFFSPTRAWVNSAVTDWPVVINTPVLNAAGHGIPAATGGQWVHPTLGSHVITIPAGVTSLGIWSDSDLNQPGGSYTWQIDAGATTTVNTSADAQAYYGFRRLTVVPLDGNAHTVTVVGTSGYTAIAGYEFFKGDSANGVHVFADGNAGYTSTQLAGAPLNQYKLTGGTTGASIKSLNQLNPAAIIYTGLVNDYSLGTAGANPVPSATSATNLVTILEGLAGACATRPSIIINIEHQRENNTMTEPWANYVAAAYSVAAANGYAIHDGGKRFGTLPTPAYNAGLLDADLVHPAPAGMWDWGYGLAGLMARG